MEEFAEESTSSSTEIGSIHLVVPNKFMTSVRQDSQVSENRIEKQDSISKPNATSCLPLSEVRKLWNEKKNRDPDVYLHELLEGAELVLPSPKPRPRDPELEQRCRRLRHQQANTQYFKMVAGLGLSTPGKPKESFGKEMRAVNKQLMAILNTVITVVCSAVFGYFAPLVFLGTDNMAAQIVVSALTGFAVLLADLYFIAKSDFLADSDASKDVPEHSKAPAPGQGVESTVSSSDAASKKMD